MTRKINISDKIRKSLTSEASMKHRIVFHVVKTVGIIIVGIWLISTNKNLYSYENLSIIIIIIAVILFDIKFIKRVKKKNAKNKKKF